MSDYFDAAVGTLLSSSSYPYYSPYLSPYYVSPYYRGYPYYGGSYPYGAYPYGPYYSRYGGRRYVCRRR